MVASRRRTHGDERPEQRQTPVRKIPDTVVLPGQRDSAFIPMSTIDGTR